MINFSKGSLIVIVLTTCVLLNNCKSDNQAELSTTTPCGKLIEFRVDNNFCESVDLPMTEFSIQYPEELKSDPPLKGQQNYHYNYFLKLDENNIQTEAISLGFSTTQKNTLMKDQLAKDIFGQVIPVIEEMGFELTDNYMGDETIDGKRYNLMRMEGKINNPEREFVGEYLIQCIIVVPEKENVNGLFLMMFANQNSDIKTFNDFFEKGCISYVWKSLKFD